MFKHQGMRGYWGMEIKLNTFYIGNRRRWAVSFTYRSLYPRVKSRICKQYCIETSPQN